MNARRAVWSLLIGLTLLALLPVSMAHSSIPAPAGVRAGPVLPSVQGNVTNCTSQAMCTYTFSNVNGTGWANSTGPANAALKMSLKLPGESVASYNLTYSTTTAKITNSYPTYTYWTVGSILGTDANSGHVVYGTTNTNYSATCHVVYRWCHYTYVTDNGTIVVHLTNAEPTATSFTCSPTFFHPEHKTNCTVTVNNLWNGSSFPTGKVHLSDGGVGIGSFSNKGSCLLASGSCSFTFRAADNACGLVDLSATYNGNSAYYKSGATTSIDVYVSGGC